MRQPSHREHKIKTNEVFNHANRTSFVSVEDERATNSKYPVHIKKMRRGTTTTTVMVIANNCCYYGGYISPYHSPNA